MNKIQTIEASLILTTLVIIITMIYQGIGIPHAAALKRINSELNTELPYEIQAKRDLLALLMAYPQHIKGIKKEQDNIYIIMQSEKKIRYDDKKAKSYEGKLANADLQDMMDQVYPLFKIDTLMQDNFDPGRIRNYEFLKEVYGATPSQIVSNLTNVSLGSKKCSFNQNNGAASALKSTFHEISILAKSNPNIYGYVFPVNGTYNNRVIAGTNQLSPHAFGIAVDLKSNPHDYWKWATKEQGQSRLTSYPKELVKAFENNGFVWGGKWAHFDIFHFEYRPELIIKSTYFIDPNSIGITDLWHIGYPETIETQSKITLIDRAFG